MGELVACTGEIENKSIIFKSRRKETTSNNDS
jgi:hypothetical protein